MQKVFSMLLVAALVNSPLALSQNTPLHAERAWFWSGDCPNGATLRLELLIEGQAVYQTEFRACHMERTAALTDAEQQKMRVFYFPGGHTFQGTYHTTTQEKIEGSIWQAGADPDALLLGVSFTAPGAHGQILLNTIHIAKPGKESRSLLDRGVVIKTYPISRS